MRNKLPAPIAFLAIFWALSGSTLAGCAGRDDYPSLAQRPAERITGTAGAASAAPNAPAPTAPAAAAVPADLTERLDRLVEQARSAHQEFTAKQHAAETLVDAAGSAPAGSENWARATGALAAIESARAQTAKPLSEIDQLDVDDRLAHATQDANSGDQAARPVTAAIGGARETVSAWVTEEDAVLTGLNGRLAQ